MLAALDSERPKAGTRLVELGWVLPKPPTPLGKYVEVKPSWLAALPKRYASDRGWQTAFYGAAR